ncbi:MAG TPA: alkaline shock response membrane anchor protein AmaP, partial [Paenibacillus sp.]|nr:alkaline shock response membrane anchor protein AmaP [Paenibacillus sp.]
MGRIADKLLLFLYSIAVLILSGIGWIAAMEWVSLAFVSSFVDAVYEPGAAKYGATAVCAALFLLSIRFLFVSLQRSRERSGSIDQR